VGETIGLGLSTSTRTAALGKTADYVGGSTYSTSYSVGQQGAGVVAGTALNNNLSIAVGSGQAVNVGVSVAGTASTQTNGSAYAKAAAINAAGIGGLTATADTTVLLNFATTATNGFALSINGTQVQNASTAPVTDAQLATNINSNASVTGVTASFANGVMTLNAVDGRNIDIAQTATATEGFQAAVAGTPNNNTVNAALTGAAGTVAMTAVGSIRLTSTEAITLSGAGAADAGFVATGYALGNSALNTASVTTVANANSTISRIDAALSTVNTFRGTLGAVQNRFDSAIANLQTMSENLSASRSRIQDADFAQETAAMTRAQILQQAGVAMLAQTNQMSQSVLTLLR
jgi:flagellin